MDYRVKLKELDFYSEWRSNYQRNIHHHKAFNIVCTEKWQIYFCIDRLKEVQPLAELPEIRNVNTLSHLNPMLVRWELSNRTKILCDQTRATAIDETRSFYEVFEVIRNDEAVPTSERGGNPISTKDSDVSIIHSKIKYNVIQAET